MKIISLTSTIEEYSSELELPEADQLLLKRSREVGKTAYAPYSAFHVGAALLLEDGTIHVGSNQENAAYPSGLCAERVALFHAGAVHPELAVTTIAVTCSSKQFKVDSPLSPCGACRQVMAETERRYGKPIRVLLAGETGAVYVIGSVKELLPLSFVADELKAK